MLKPVRAKLRLVMLAPINAIIFCTRGIQLAAILSWYGIVIEIRIDLENMDFLRYLLLRLVLW